MLAHEKLGVVLLFVTLWFVAERNCDWKLTTTCAKNLLQKLSSARVKLNWTKLPVSGPFPLFCVDRSCFNFNETTNVFSVQLVYIAWNLLDLVRAVAPNSEPLAHDWDWKFVLTSTCGFGVKNWGLIQTFAVGSEAEVERVRSPSFCSLIFLLHRGFWSEEAKHFIKLKLLLI